MTIEAAIACNRFGLGAKPGELDSARSNPKAWLKRQIASTPKDFPGKDLRSSKDVLSNFFRTRGTKLKSMQSEAEQKAIRAKEKKLRRLVFPSELKARLIHSSQTNYSFHERLVHFWSNHFSVSRKGPILLLIVGAYEREAIRPNILGSFEQLASAAIYHPAMLHYLDNTQSIGPNSRFGKRRDRGLNENLAREILELHTVTPEAQYSQSDVKEFAKALTGWTVSNARWGGGAIGETSFFDLLHEPGSRNVLGRRYSESGSSQADRIISDLSRNPHTAQNIAYKLAKHFTADVPPASLVDRLRNTFLRTNGNLTAIYHTLIDSPETWNPVAQKVKTPSDLLISASRLLGARSVFAGSPRKVYSSLAQEPFGAPSPKGWADDAKTWLGPDSLTKRIEWANRVSRRAQKVDARTLLQQGLGSALSDRTLTAVSRAESGEQAIALALMSPDFQRR